MKEYIELKEKFHNDMGHPWNEVISKEIVTSKNEKLYVSPIKIGDTEIGTWSSDEEDYEGDSVYYIEPKYWSDVMEGNTDMLEDSVTAIKEYVEENVE
tara:strand:- start:46 stop:339 length:294 start_codon:yes stop_codon:yes gene_type:complete